MAGLVPDSNPGGKTHAGDKYQVKNGSLTVTKSSDRHFLVKRWALIESKIRGVRRAKRRAKFMFSQIFCLFQKQMECTMALYVTMHAWNPGCISKEVTRVKTFGIPFFYDHFSF